VRATGATRVAGVIGSPVRHSLSPTLHNAAFAALDLDWVYVAFDVRPGAALEALAAMRTLGLAGFSVTMPHKSDIARGVDVCTPEAETLAAVNTVTPLTDGRLEGHSTDGPGFVAALRRDEEIEPAGLHVTVLGAGGAARAVVDALGRAGAASVAVLNRSPARAVVCAALAGRRGRVGRPSDITTADLVVNATPVGMGDGATDLPLDPARLRPGQIVADLVYHPLDTALLRAARHRGCRTVDGLGMLVHQAALQQERWHGLEAPRAVMRQAALAELARRA
jgi:shikimate dehydrogenase